MTIVLLISLTLNATIGAIAISFGLENKKLRKALDQADNNDARDARGRYSGRRAF
jgi:hypothetical protein